MTTMAAAATGAMPARNWLRKEYLVLLAVLVLFSLVVPRFFSAGNFLNIAKVASVIVIASCGQAIALLLAGIEFSFGASVALASVVNVGVAMQSGTAAGFAAGAATCIAIGAANGFFIAYTKMPSFMATLGMMLAAQGLASSIAGGLPMDAPFGDEFFFLAQGRILSVPMPIILAAAAVGALGLLLNVLTIGRVWKLIGISPKAAELAGLKVRPAIFLGFLIAGAYCALAGLILTSRVGSGQPMLAPELAFQAIAACAVGGIPFSGGEARVSQVLAGSLVIAAIHNAIILLNLQPAYQLVATALAILLAVMVHKLPSLRPIPGRVGAR